MDVQATIDAIKILRGLRPVEHVKAGSVEGFALTLEIETPVAVRIIDDAVWALESSLRNYLTRGER